MQTRTFAVSTLALAMLAGCAGHGAYTSEGLSIAQQRAAQLKSGTEYSMAMQAFTAGDLDRAMKRIEASLAANADVSKSHVLKGRILAEKGQLGPAMTALEQAIALDPNDFEAWYYEGVTFERLSRPAEAMARFQKASELDPTSAQYRIAAAETMIDQGLIEEARTYLLDANDRFEHNAATRQTLGRIAMLTNDPGQAATYFTEARLLAPEDRTIVEDLVNAQIGCGRFAEAEYNLGALLAAPDSKDRRDLRHLRAQCLLELDRAVEARSILQELTRGSEGENDVEAWIGLGRVAYTIGDDRTLKAAASRLVAIAPTRCEGPMLQALHQRSAGQREAALESLDHAARLAPADRTVLMLRSLVLSELGRSAEAADGLRALLALEPENSAAAQLLAAVDAMASAGER